MMFFNDFVCNNIVYGQIELLIECVCEVVVVVYVDEFIMEFENGYDMVIGELGYQFFGGQCQWFVIVCVFFKNVFILVFDEVMLNFDIEFEILVQCVIYNFMEGCMVFVIVYCFFMVRCVDCIFVFDCGKVIEEGDYDELLSFEGVYKCLYDLQFKDQLWQWFSVF